MGGTEWSLVRLLKNLDKNKFKLFIAVLKGGGEMIPLYKGVSDDLFEINSGVFNCFGVFKLLGVVDELKIDIIHSFLFHSNFVSRILKFFRKQVVCVNSHRTVELKQKQHLIIDKFTKSLVDYEIANADKVAGYIMEKTGTFSDKICTIYNGVESVEKGRYGKLRRNLDRIRFGCAGSFAEAKGQVFLLKVFTLIDKNNKAELHFWGDGPLLKEAQNFTAEEKLKNVYFHDRTKDYSVIYENIDCLIIPSFWEGMPNVMLEALVRGIPVIASDVGGVSEVADKWAGVVKVVAPGNVSAFKDALTRDLEFYLNMKKCVIKNRNEIQRVFDLKTMAEKHEKVYEELQSRCAKKTLSGNFYNKYVSKNFIEKWLVSLFLRNLIKTLKKIKFDSLLDVGSGEGYALSCVKENFPDVKIYGSDYDSEVLDENKLNFDGIITKQFSASAIPFDANSFDVVTCCEVLEHVADVHGSLTELCRVTRKYVLLTVPFEPWWRVCNILRGKYWSRKGNTEGHVNHWNMSSFNKLIKKYFMIKEHKIVGLWQFILAERG